MCHISATESYVMANADSLGYLACKEKGSHEKHLQHGYQRHGLRAELCRTAWLLLLQSLHCLLQHMINSGPLKKQLL